MRIGVPRETKEGERRLALVPAGVRALAAAGHEVVVESGAGLGVGLRDAEFAAAGARIAQRAAAWAVDLAVKVKEIQPGEREHLAPGLALFGFQHLAGEPEHTRALAGRGVSAIAFEMVHGPDGLFPLLAPMSAIAGRMAIPLGAHLLGLPQGGNGTLLGGAPGAQPAQVLVLGAGHAGEGAAELASAMGASVTILCRSERTRERLRAKHGARMAVGIATGAAVEAAALAADLVVGAVFVPAMPTPKLLPRALVRRMRPGAVIVDISIDAGGVAETSRPTTHSEPTFVAEGVVHYCVGNMPAAYARSATAALAAAALPFVLEMAGKGVARALAQNAALRAGVVLWNGRPTHPGIAAEAGLDWSSVEEALAA